MKIAYTIREIRTSKSISQEFMAIKLGIDTSNYSRIERGTAPLTVERLMAIAEILGMSFSEMSKACGLTEDISEETRPYLKHLETEIAFLRKQLHEKEIQLSHFINSKNEERTFMNTELFSNTRRAYQG
jgi:transcriptional regulator with XRE-family HTH domain